MLLVDVKFNIVKILVILQIDISIQCNPNNVMGSLLSAVHINSGN